ncbi:MAG: glutamate--tRNA ligase [Bacteroidota bacterium]
MDTKVRVRFAPSPTGPLHIGGVRTALYNYLFAKKNKGSFILRIEDTDQTRFVHGAEKYIMDSLKWCGIEPNESPSSEGQYGPYRQSERKGIYKEYADYLLEKGYAYYAFDTPEELEAMRERLKAARVASPQYNAITRMQMKNSLTLPEDEVKERLESGEPYVIRIKIPRKEEIRLNDLVRGWVMVHSSAMDDKVLMKSDGMPTYHLANVVDDHLMKITHVIRGEEWLPSAPLHVLLYKYLGWENETPKFAHLPLLLKPDGNGKLSKRDGDKLGFPVFPLNWDDKETNTTSPGFKEQGYLEEAMINFLAFLGWNPGTEQELFSLDELVDAFSVERIGKAGTKFDIEKAKWFNEQYLRAKPDEELGEMLTEGLENQGKSIDSKNATKIAALMKERATFPRDLWEQGFFFFEEPSNYDEKTIKKKWNDEVKSVIQDFISRSDEISDFSSEKIKETISHLAENRNLGLGRVMPGFRLAVTGMGTGPDLMRILEILGKEKVIQRLQVALNKL